MIKTCSILGCGWLGLPLAQLLISKGMNVRGSTTREDKLGDLQRLGIRPYHIRLSTSGMEGNIESFLNSDLLILNIPPGRRNPDVEKDFPATMARFIRAISQSPLRHVLFISSTSVYGACEGEITEDMPRKAATGSGKALIRVEDMLEKLDQSVTLLRFGGLVGGDRHPGRFLAGRSQIKNPAHPVNLIHRDDCVQLIYEIIRQEKWNDTFHACADKHPPRSAFYTRAALKMGLRPPVFGSANEGQGKSFSNEKIKSALNYRFRYPDPDSMVYTP